MSTGVLHRAAGLTITAQAPVPGLPPGAPGETPDVYLHLGIPAPWQPGPTRTLYPPEQPDRQIRPPVTVYRHPRGFHFAYADDTAVWIDTPGSQVWCTWPPTSTIEDTATYLTGPILGFVLRLRGALALHASAIREGEAALVLVGPHGAGKSTTAAALGRRGCAVITDDVLHLRRSGAQWLAEPFASSLRLWPEGAALVLGEHVPLPRITPTWDKRALGLGSRELRPVASPTAVGSIVFLEPRQRAPHVPRLDSLGAAEAMVRLATHSSASHLLEDAARAREFHALSDLVRSVPCIRATASSTPGDFGAFVALLHDWARRGAIRRGY